jgi:hypothetical protein
VPERKKQIKGVNNGKPLIDHSEIKGSTNRFAMLSMENQKQESDKGQPLRKELMLFNEGTSVNEVRKDFKKRQRREDNTKKGGSSAPESTRISFQPLNNIPFIPKIIAKPKTNGPTSTMQHGVISKNMSNINNGVNDIGNGQLSTISMCHMEGGRHEINEEVEQDTHVMATEEIIKGSNMCNKHETNNTSGVHINNDGSKASVNVNSMAMEMT